MSDQKRQVLLTTFSGVSQIREHIYQPYTKYRVSLDRQCSSHNVTKGQFDELLNLAESISFTIRDGSKNDDVRTDHLITIQVNEFYRIVGHANYKEVTA